MPSCSPMAWPLASAERDDALVICPVPRLWMAKRTNRIATTATELTHQGARHRAVTLHRSASKISERKNVIITVSNEQF